MSEFKADMGRGDLQPRNPLSTAPPVKAQLKANENGGGKELPEQPAVSAPELADDQSVENAVAKLNEYVQTTARTLNFQVDDDSGKTVIKVYDRESEQLIRQIPNELVLELARRLNEEEPSLLFEAQV